MFFYYHIADVIVKVFIILFFIQPELFFFGTKAFVSFSAGVQLYCNLIIKLLQYHYYVLKPNYYWKKISNGWVSFKCPKKPMHIFFYFFFILCRWWFAFTILMKGCGSIHVGKILLKTNSQESKDGIFEITIKLFCQRVDTFWFKPQDQ